MEEELGGVLDEGSGKSFFKEASTVEKLLQRDTFLRDKTAASTVCDILSEYQEFGELLDGHLEMMVTALFDMVIARIRSTRIEEDEKVFAIPDTEGLQRVFNVIYTLCKVRGHKTVVKFFPHDVRDLEPCLDLLMQQKRLDFDSWQIRYGLLLWLSILVLIPFDLATVDTLATTAAQTTSESATSEGESTVDENNPEADDERIAQAVARQGGLVWRLTTLAQSYLSDAGPSREAAAILLGKLFARSDLHADRLRAFCHWTRKILRSKATTTASSAPNSDSASSATSLGLSHGILVTGTLHALAEIIRAIPRQLVRQIVAPMLWPTLMQRPPRPPPRPDFIREEQEARGSAGGYYDGEGSGIQQETSEKWADEEEEAKAAAELYNGLPERAVKAKYRKLLNDYAAQVPSWEKSRLCRKLWTKVVQRMGLAHLRPRIAAWRYQRGARSLKLNLSAVAAARQTTDTTAILSDTEQQQQQVHTSKSDDTEEVDFGDDAFAPVPALDDDEDPAQYEEENVESTLSLIEDVIDCLLRRLNDEATMVRWSAAKGIGRIVMNLSRYYGDQVVAAVLSMLASPLNDAKDPLWHGACLALAELARRGLLLPHRLRTTVPLVLRALRFDVRRGNFSVGAHVRDAACYVVWAFARAYSPETMSRYVHKLARTLLSVAVFDRDVNCRRAAAAAFQENVGRQGNFPYGIEIVTTADYFSLALRLNSFVSVAAQIAALSPEVYGTFFLDRLIEVGVLHWDQGVRQHAAGALISCASTSRLLLKRAANLIVPELIRLSATALDVVFRHGALLALSHLLVLVAGRSVASLMDEDENQTATPALNIMRALIPPSTMQVENEAQTSISVTAWYEMVDPFESFLACGQKVDFSISREAKRECKSSLRDAIEACRLFTMHLRGAPEGVDSIENSGVEMTVRRQLFSLPLILQDKGFLNDFGGISLREPVCHLIATLTAFADDEDPEGNALWIEYAPKYLTILLESARSTSFAVARAAGRALRLILSIPLLQSSSTGSADGSFVDFTIKHLIQTLLETEGCASAGAGKVRLAASVQKVQAMQQQQEVGFAAQGAAFALGVLPACVFEDQIGSERLVCVVEALLKATSVRYQTDVATRQFAAEALAALVEGNSKAFSTLSTRPFSALSGEGFIPATLVGSPAHPPAGPKSPPYIYRYFLPTPIEASGSPSSEAKYDKVENQTYPLWWACTQQLLAILEDYTTTTRGDVGSHVRGAALYALSVILPSVWPHVSYPLWFQRQVCHTVVAAALQQAAERISRLRRMAFDAVLRILLAQLKGGQFLPVPHRTIMVRLFEQAARNQKSHYESTTDISAKPKVLALNQSGHISPEEVDGLRQLLQSETDWSSDSIGFAVISRLLQLECYRPYLMQGVLISAGGLSETCARLAVGALKDFIAWTGGSGKAKARAASGVYDPFDASEEAKNSSDTLMQALMEGAMVLSPPDINLFEREDRRYPSVPYSKLAAERKIDQSDASSVHALPLTMGAHILWDALRVLYLYRGNKRVTTPVMAACKLIITQTGGKKLIPDELLELGAGFLSRIIPEISKTDNIPKLFAGIQLLTALYAVVITVVPKSRRQTTGSEEQPLSHKILSVALSALSHRFPKVRATAAVELYSSLMPLTFDEIFSWDEDDGEGQMKAEEAYEEALSLLSEVPWNGEDMKLISDSRLRLLELFGVVAPKTEIFVDPNPSGSKAGTKATTATGTYADLVREMY